MLIKYELYSRAFDNLVYANNCDSKAARFGPNGTKVVVMQYIRYKLAPTIDSKISSSNLFIFIVSYLNLDLRSILNASLNTISLLLIYRDNKVAY